MSLEVLPYNLMPITSSKEEALAMTEEPDSAKAKFGYAGGVPRLGRQSPPEVRSMVDDAVCQLSLIHI